MANTQEAPKTEVKAETPKPPVQAQTKKATAEDAKNHLREVSDVLITQFSGKPGYNVYTWLHKNVIPLCQALEKEDVTQETIDRAMSVKSEGVEPKVKDEPIPQRLVENSKLAPAVKTK